MTLSKINIHHFRNIDHAQLSLSPHFNFIVGDNGSGKTSLLEAIYMLGHGRAFRHTQSNRIIQHEQPELVLFSEIKNTHQQVHSIGLAKSRNSENKIKIDGDEGFRLADLAKLLPIQLITPEGFDLLSGGPKYRRAFIDWGCFHHYPEFVHLWNNLKRLFKQRNALLKQSHSYNQLLPWDKELAPIAEKISHIRADYSQQIFPEIIKTCHDFLPEYQLNCQYYQGWEHSTDYAEILYKQYERDKLLSYTSVGPHKADIRLRVDNIPVEDLLSRGQLKLLMCALRLSQGEYYSKQSSQACVYLIDDFASELDNNKRELLAKRLKLAHSQVFITAVNQAQITHMIDENDKIFHIKSGIIS
ncbi:DNA replication/repair protein RecF [Gilliamella sp. App6-5]|jgi:DNA replication and repair protein RecF|uniref:DNA replication/repair protein RecF n=1 Tax=Gilliamella sp. App6-5 TaxID=3120232 RepID=UPI00080E5B18|nr:DNA replication/repair protein RecF [Gilliamella apicola]OCG11137.1 DNA replication/repair protein RecF [Gilliamella apicola]